MKQCICGRDVRLSAIKVSVNRHKGIAHSIVHVNDGTKPCIEGDWSCCMMKPYPKKESDTAWAKMMDRWDAMVNGDG